MPITERLQRSDARRRLPTRAAILAITLPALSAANLTAAGNRRHADDATTPKTWHVDLRASNVVGARSAQFRQTDWNRLLNVTDKVTLSRFPLPGGESGDMQLSRFRVTTPQTRFVLGTRGRPDRPMAFDPESVVLLKGRFVDRPDSRVVLAATRRGLSGFVSTAPGGPTLRVSPFNPSGTRLSANQFAVYPAGSGDSLPPNVPPCGLTEHPTIPVIDSAPAHDGHGRSFASPSAYPGGAGETQLGLRRFELAVETDNEYFGLFGNDEDAAAYVLELYASISAIYMRDFGLAIDVTYVRLWDDPDDLFNEADPFSPFRTYWNANMGGVHRDLAQFLTGRRNLPYGGVATVQSLCSTFNGYSVAGYVLGHHPTGNGPGATFWDVIVAAHEMGHNCGTFHTHDGYSPPIDQCGSIGILSRGTIMSYCHTLSGGNSNIDLRFHRRVQDVIGNFVNQVTCLENDCNLNGDPDADDIAGGSSLDANQDGVPDECEDCNSNSVLDDDDVASQQSPDVNGNGIPDECEPDCNNNLIPDTFEIATGSTDDLYGDNVPDECDADCNTNGVSDYNEVQAAMSLDVDRNVVLDACQDCNGDATLDADELARAHNLWVTNGVGATAVIREFHAKTGILLNTFESGHIDAGQDLIIAPNRHALVTSANDDRVAEFDQTGAYVGDFVTTGSGGLDYPTGLTFGPNGNLFVSSRLNNSVLEFDGATGDFVGQFVGPPGTPPFRPFGLAFGPNGNLFVATESALVNEYDGASGEFIRAFVFLDDNGGLDTPKGITFKADGNLLVASYGSDAVLEFDGKTGDFVRRFDFGGSTTGFWAIDRPWGIRVGPDGNVYVSSNSGNAAIHSYDGRTGYFLRSFYVLASAGLNQPTGFDFVPGQSTDCNLNGLPDECDVSLGTSPDINDDLIPDECQVDCNANGNYDRYDLVPFGLSLDCNGTGVPDECELQENDCDANRVPDECDPDADGDGIPDACAPCSSNQNCFDDQPCTFDRCDDMQCANIVGAYGDVAGPNKHCGPDGTVNIFDIFAMLDGFLDVYSQGCETANLDIASLADPCGPDGDINISDILAVLDAFQAPSSCCSN